MPCLLLLVSAALAAEPVWLEGEQLVSADAPRGVDGAPPGWYRVPYLYGDESAAWSLVSARTLAEGQASHLATRVGLPAEGDYYVWVRVGCRDRPARCGFTLRLDDCTFDVRPDPGESDAKHLWIRLGDWPVTLGREVAVELSDDEPTTAAALDVLVLTPDAEWDPNAVRLPSWPGQRQLEGVAARWWVPTLFDQPLSLIRGLTWPVLLSLVNPTAEAVDGAVVVVDLPPGVELLDPCDRQFGESDFEHFSLTAATPRRILRSARAEGGERVELTLGALPAGLDGMTSNRGAVALFLKTAPDAAEHLALRLACRQPGSEVEQNAVTTPVLTLPEPPGRGPQRAYWLLDVPYLMPFSGAESTAFLQSAAKLGYNRFNLLEGLRHDDPAYDRLQVAGLSYLAQRSRESGVVPVLGMARWIPWTPYRTYSDRYLERMPQAAAVQAPGSRALSQGRGMVSPAYLLDPDCTYFDERLRALADAARTAGISEFYWDYEENRAQELSFDPVSLASFRSAMGLSPEERLGPGPILLDRRLREAWIRFRCGQNAAIAALLRRRLAAQVPDLRLFIYCGFQTPQTMETYGVDWRLVAPYADGVIAGSGWANISMIPPAYETWEAVRPAAPEAQTMFVEHAIDDWPGQRRWSDPSTTAARVVLAAAAGAVGLNDCCSIYAMEGVHLSGIAEAAAFVADHEELLRASTHRTLLDTNGDGFIDTVTVEDRRELLTVAANGTQHPQTLKPRTPEAGDEVPEELTLAKGEWRAWTTERRR